MFRCATQWLLATLFVLIACPAHAAIDAYLCVTDPGYTGEVVAPPFTGCSNLFDFGQTAFLDGAPVARDIKLDKPNDTMSNPLRNAMVNLTTLNEVKIRVVNTNTAQTLEFLDIRLLGARVDSHTVSLAAGGQQAIDTFGFSAANIEIKYSPTTKTGALGTPTYSCWNVAANTAKNSPCP